MHFYILVFLGEDFEKCRPLINVAEVKHGLKMDFCPTGSMQSLCDGLKSLQEECQAKAHILVCWEDRTNLMCGKIFLSDDF